MCGDGRGRAALPHATGAAANGATEKLNHKYHFSEGLLHFTHPTGENDSIKMTEPWTASDWLRAIGMSVAAIAMAAAVVASGGLALGLAPTITTLGTISAVGFLGAAGLNVTATRMEMREKDRFGLLTPEDERRAYMSIAFDIIGAAALGVGRIAMIAEGGATALAAGRAVSSTARTLALINGRYLFLLSRSAAVMKRVALAADVLQVGTATVDFVRAFNAIRSQQGLSPADRDAALAKLIGAALLTGGLMTISLNREWRICLGPPSR